MTKKAISILLFPSLFVSLTSLYLLQTRQTGRMPREGGKSDTDHPTFHALPTTVAPNGLVYCGCAVCREEPVNHVHPTDSVLPHT
jgi:hypothetical protein